jgi:hypothetical protein
MWQGEQDSGEWCYMLIKMIYNGKITTHNLEEYTPEITYLESDKLCQIGEGPTDIISIKWG